MLICESNTVGSERGKPAPLVQGKYRVCGTVRGLAPSRTQPQTRAKPAPLLFLHERSAMAKDHFIRARVSEKWILHDDVTLKIWDAINKE